MMGSCLIAKKIVPIQKNENIKMFFVNNLLEHTLLQFSEIRTPNRNDRPCSASMLGKINIKMMDVTNIIWSLNL